MRTDLSFVQGIKFMIFVRMFLYLNDMFIHKNVNYNKKQTNNVKLIKTLKNTVLLNSEFWLKILRQLKKLCQQEKGELSSQSGTWITHLLTELSSPFPLRWERNPSWSIVSEKMKLFKDLLKSFTYSENRRSLRVNPGTPAIAQVNKFSGDKMFLQLTHSFSGTFQDTLQMELCALSLSQP